MLSTDTSDQVSKSLASNTWINTELKFNNWKHEAFFCQFPLLLPPEEIGYNDVNLVTCTLLMNSRFAHLSCIAQHSQESTPMSQAAPHRFHGIVTGKPLPTRPVESQKAKYIPQHPQATM
ncbi:uncharacterized protein LOC144504435 [Mustelus asterias]